VSERERNPGKKVPSKKVLDKWQTGNYDPYPMEVPPVKKNNFVGSQLNRPGSGR